MILDGESSGTADEQSEAQQQSPGQRQPPVSRPQSKEQPPGKQKESKPPRIVPPFVPPSGSKPDGTIRLGDGSEPPDDTECEALVLDESDEDENKR